MIRPRRLSPGDRIADVAAADLNAALRDPAIRAIRVAADHRALDDLDLAAVARDPKPILGTGGTTFVHLELWRRCGLVAYHGDTVGPLAPETRGIQTGWPAESEGPCAAGTGGTEPGQSEGPRVIETRCTETWSPGSAEGPLLGGDLAAIRSMVGAGLPDLTGAILLLTGERTLGLGQVDRQLTHLRRAGILTRVRGVALGHFTGFDGYADRGWTLTDVLADHLRDLPVPVLAGLPVGPGHPAVPVGTTAVLDADERTLKVDAGLS